VTMPLAHTLMHVVPKANTRKPLCLYNDKDQWSVVKIAWTET